MSLSPATELYHITDNLFLEIKENFKNQVLHWSVWVINVFHIQNGQQTQ